MHNFHGILDPQIQNTLINSFNNYPQIQMQPSDIEKQKQFEEQYLIHERNQQLKLQQARLQAQQQQQARLQAQQQHQARLLAQQQQQARLQAQQQNQQRLLQQQNLVMPRNSTGVPNPNITNVARNFPGNGSNLPTKPTSSIPSHNQPQNNLSLTRNLLNNGNGAHAQSSSNTRTPQAQSTPNPLNPADKRPQQNQNVNKSPYTNTQFSPYIDNSLNSKPQSASNLLDMHRRKIASQTYGNKAPTPLVKNNQTSNLTSNSSDTTSNTINDNNTNDHEHIIK